MKGHRLLYLLTVTNVIVLAVLLFRGSDFASAHAEPRVLRAAALEIVDATGRVRASIGVMTAGTSASGAPYPETVLLRLNTERGRPSVKISATEQGSGLSFSGPTGTKDTWLTLGTGEAESTLRLRNEDGRERVVAP